jgi:cytochrome oxidase assembly protein ShyY1
MRRHRLLSPVWVVAHVLVAVVLVGFPLLGLWQLERHEQQQATDDALAQRPQQPPLTAAQLDGDPQRLAYRRVDVGGTWQPRDEVLLSTRPHQGRPGHHVLTPLRLSDGSAVLVNRGWVPYDVDAPPIAAAAPPSGEVRVTGVAVPGRDARRAGELDGQGREPGAIAAEDTVEFVSHGDPALVGRLVGENLPGIVVRADDGHRRAGASLPVTVAPPQPEQGVNHLAYAVQWFLFTGVVAVGYPLLLRRRAREPGTGGPPGVAGADDPATPDAQRQPAP